MLISFDTPMLPQWTLLENLDLNKQMVKQFPHIPLPKHTPIIKNIANLSHV